MTTILCIEDEKSIRADIVEELRDAGFDVIEAMDGEDGLEKATASKPDLVLCDISMPKMDGLELLSFFRMNDSGLDDIPFIFLTALSDRQNIINGLNIGADDYLVKPVDFDLLLAKINASLRQINRMLRKRQGEHVRLYKALTQAPVENSEETEAEVSMTIPPLSVVLVGQKHPSVTMIQKILESRGNGVRIYESGKAFVGEVDKLEPNIVLLSLYSNDMQAPFAAKMAQRKNPNKIFPCVLIWPDDMKEMPDPSKLIFFDHVLELPCPEKEIMEMIENWASV